MLDDATPVSELKNIGSGIAGRLFASGVKTRGDLHKIAAAGAYRKLAQAEPERRLPVCYYLYALDAALANCDWRDLSNKRKAQLLEQAGVDRR